MRVRLLNCGAVLYDQSTLFYQFKILDIALDLQLDATTKTNYLKTLPLSPIPYPPSPTTFMLDFYRQFAAILLQEPVVLATIIDVKGSVPREVGAKMLVGKGGAIVGTIGGGAGEAKVITQALQVLENGEKQIVQIDLTGTPQRETQGVCGGFMQVWLERWQGESSLNLVNQIIDCLNRGQISTLVTPLTKERSPHLEIPPSSSLPSPSAPSSPSPSSSPSPLLPSPTPDTFTEPLLPPPTLLIIGAGHCAIPLAHIAHLAGFRVLVQDDRPELATIERFPDASLVLAKPVAEIVSVLPESQLYVALVTRGFTFDLEALRVLIQLPTEYIGMIGSEKRVRKVFQTLQKSMETSVPLAKVYAPIGLDIGALNPEEIAVSICAELIKVRRGGSGRSLSERVRLTKQPSNGNHHPLADAIYVQPSQQQQ